ncbi:leucine-rich repeat-containing protein 15 [Tribolium castaneum]
MFFIFLFILVITTEKSSGVCRIDNVTDSQGENVKRKQYIHCQFENISSNLYTKVKPFYDYYKSDTIEWLEISDTDNRLLSSGALGPLPVMDLRIHNANIHEIEPNAFSGIDKYLGKLSLKNNKLSSIKDYYFKHLFLIYLDLSFNNITSISENSFLENRYLGTLILKNNLLSVLPPNLFPRSNHWRITHLDVSFNKLVTLDSKIFHNLWSLVELRINDNYLNHLDENIFSENDDLNYLFINNNRFRGFHNLTLPKSMNTVNASNNLIAFFNLRKHTFINTLDLSSNGISSTKDLSFTNATVSELLLDNNNLESTHDTFITYFPSLWHLSLTNNKLTQINHFKNSTKLTRLNLAKNNLCTNDLLNLPSSLNELLVSFNNLTEIAFDSLQGLKFLKILHLEHNQIQKIALGAFRNLGQLIELDLSNNKISVLGIGVFGGLNSLKHLDLSENELQQISNAFYNLRALRIINLSKTKVKYNTVETILLQLPNVEQVGLAENGWACSHLINITTKFGKKVIDMGKYNITNVDGVACDYEETPEHNKQKSTNLSRFEADYHGLFKFQICFMC